MYPEIHSLSLLSSRHLIVGVTIIVLYRCVCVCFFRVTLLELLFAQLREEDSEDCGIPSSVARFLASTFQKGCGAVLTLATGSASSDEVQLLNLTRCIFHCPTLTIRHKDCDFFFIIIF